MSTSVQGWVQIIAAILAALGLIFAILRAGVTAVRSSATVAASVEELTKTVQRIDVRVETYIAGENTRDDGMEAWRRAVEGRLGSIEASLAVLARGTAPRRRGDARP